MCVTSLLCGPQADLWLFYRFLRKRFFLSYKGIKRENLTADRERKGELVPVLLRITAKPERV